MRRPTGPIAPDPSDDLVRRAVRDLPGASAATRTKLQQHFAAEQALARRARMIRVQAVVGLSAAAVLILAVFLNLDWFRATFTPAPQQTAHGNQPETEPHKPADPQPSPVPDTNNPAPEPEPLPPIEPAPREIERPAPTPEQPTPKQPEPVEPKPAPGPTVDEPKPVAPDTPRNPDGTQVRPEPAKVQIGRIVAGAPKVRVRYGAGDWADAGADLVFNSGVRLSVARGQADLWLSGGTLLRFDGEIALTRDGDLTTIAIESKSIYADNLGLNEPLALSVGDLRGSASSAVIVAQRDQSALELACMHGVASLGGEAVAPGFERRATTRSMGTAKKFAGSRLTRDLPARVVYREEFDKAPEGGLYGEGETIEGGNLVRRGGGNFAAFRYNPTVTVQPGMMLRFRARTRAVSALQLEVFLDKPNDKNCFNQYFKPAKVNEWQVFEVRLADFADKQNPAVRMEAGQLLRNFKLHMEGTSDAMVEVDWVEYVRIQEE